MGNINIMLEFKMREKHVITPGHHGTAFICDFTKAPQEGDIRI